MGAMVNVTASESAIARPAVGWSPWAYAGRNFIALLVILLALFHDATLSMASIWFSSSVYHHGAIVAPISLWMIATRRDWLERSPSGDWAGVIIIAVASFVWLISRAATTDLLGHFAAVIAIIGAVVAIYGYALARRWLFPLGFLFFMVPAGAELTPALQLWASNVVTAMLNASGVETARDGFMLTTSAGRFEMAESCAGLRFLLASAMISSVVAWFAFSDWKKRTWVHFRRTCRSPGCELAAGLSDCAGRDDDRSTRSASGRSMSHWAGFSIVCSSAH